MGDLIQVSFITDDITFYVSLCITQLFHFTANLSVHLMVYSFMYDGMIIDPQILTGHKRCIIECVFLCVCLHLSRTTIEDFFKHDNFFLLDHLLRQINR